LLQKYRAVNVSPAGRASIIGKPKGVEKMLISTFAVGMMCLALVGAIYPRWSDICSESVE
jgi:hypothetical protein